MTSRCLGLSTVVAGAVLALAAGCSSSGTGVLPMSHDAPLNLAGFIPESARVARSQQPDQDRRPAPPSVQPVVAQKPAAPEKSDELPTPNLPTPGGTAGEVQELRARLNVRALVNGKPIFDDEVMQGVAQREQELRSANPNERPAVLAKIFNEQLKQLIDHELILQDAFRKLEKNPKLLDDLKRSARKEFEKNMRQRAGQMKVTVEKLQRMVGKEGLEVLRRQMERNYIASQYIRSRVYPELYVRHAEIREYYDKHREEFQTLDRVKWQDIFIAVGPSHPTIEDALRFAQEILDRIRSGQGFDEFLRFDEGDSWSYRKGEGNGQLLGKGEIRPPELEAYLAKMGDGEIGPAVTLSTGVHLFRVLKREHGGPMPFDAKVQEKITNRLKAAKADVEYKGLVKGLRERAHIDIIPGLPGPS
jgi:parvulin-like peptidyl-prolyl isomerase